LICIICKKEVKNKKVIKDGDKEHEICDYHPVPDNMIKEKNNV